MQRMGADARIIVERLEIASVRDVTPIEAVPDPALVPGGLWRSRCSAPPGPARRAGSSTSAWATALVRVEAPHAKTVRLITRGKDIEGADLQSVVEDVPGVPLRRLPTSGPAAGGQALRNIAAGEIATSTAIAGTPARPTVEGEQGATGRRSVRFHDRPFSSPNADAG